MEPIVFQVGSEKRFYDWISKLNDKDKVALISHNDLDGIASAKIVNEVIDADVVKLVNYEELNDDLILNLKGRGINKAIFTDLMASEVDFVVKAGKEFSVLWIDHHKIISDYNSPAVVYLNSGGNNDYCAAYLCYYLFSKTQELENYDWLVACACLSDFTVYKNREWIKKIFNKYGDASEIKPMSSEMGVIQDVKRRFEFAIIYFKRDNELEKMLKLISKRIEDTEIFEKYAREVNAEVSSILNRFEKEKVELNGRYLFELNPRFGIGSIISNALSMKNSDKTVIILRPIDENMMAVSMRRQDSKEDMDKLVKFCLKGLENASGGGHVPAAGGHFLKKDLAKFKERLNKI